MKEKTANIDILEDYIELIEKGYCEDCNELCNISKTPVYPSKAVAQAISNLIAENKELKEFKENIERIDKKQLDKLYKDAQKALKEYRETQNKVAKLEEENKELKEEKEELKRENLEIRDWKYVIDSPIDLDKLKELDLIKIKGKEYISKSIYNELEKDKKALINNYSKILGEFIPKSKVEELLKEKIEWCIKASNSGLNAIQYACSKEDEIEKIERQKNISTMISILKEILQELLDERNNTDEH